MRWMKRQSLGFIPRRVAQGPDGYRFQMARFVEHRSGIYQVKTLFPHDMATEEAVKQLGYDTEALIQKVLGGR